MRKTLLLLFLLAGLAVATNAEEIAAYMQHRSAALVCRSGIACDSKVVVKVDKGQVGPLEANIDVSRTGAPVGTVLTAYTGPMTVTQDGTVIDGKIINGMLTVLGDNVVIKNCEVSFDGAWGIQAADAKNITVQDCTLVGPGFSGDSDSAIVGSGTFLRNNISQCENGILLQEGSSVVKGNYIYDLRDSADGHYDGIAAQGHQNGVLIEDNTVFGAGTSDIFIKNDFGPINNVVVNHNYLAGHVEYPTGDPGYNLYVDGRGNGGPITNITITNNVVEKAHFGYFAIDDENTNPVISGNIQFLPGQMPTLPSTTPTPDATPTPDVTPTPG